MEIRTSRLLVTAGILVLCCMPEICRCGDPAALMQSDEPPIVPVGLDAYRMWDKLPCHRIGVRAYMRSTYDREGNNRSADASHYLYQQSDEFNVALDVEGPGVLYFKRTNHWHGSPWHYEVDGEDFIVVETATADPVNAKKTLKATTFIPEEPFPAESLWSESRYWAYCYKMPKVTLPSN